MGLTSARKNATLGAREEPARQAIPLIVLMLKCFERRITVWLGPTFTFSFPLFSLNNVCSRERKNKTEFMSFMKGYLFCRTCGVHGRTSSPVLEQIPLSRWYRGKYTLNQTPAQNILFLNSNIADLRLTIQFVLHDIHSSFNYISLPSHSGTSGVPTAECH